MAESIFTSQTPTTPNAIESGGISLGVTFVPAVDGEITGVRFYAPTTVTGTWTGALYQPTVDDDPEGSGAGTTLATATLGGAPTPGAWNVIAFSSPVPVTAGTPYRAVYHNTEGRYVSTASFPGFVSGGVTNGNLFATPNGYDPGIGTTFQGTFRTGATIAYPSNSFNQGNYFADVIFEAAASEGAAAFSIALAVAGAGDAPAVVPNDGLSDGFGISIEILATGETPAPGGASGAAAFSIVLALAGAGAAEVPAEMRCGWEGIDPGALGACDDWADRPVETRNAALSLAVEYLWARTGRRFGVCPVTIRPRQSRGEPLQYQAFPVLPGASDGRLYPAGPFLFAGRWFNAGCGIACCGARGCAIVLPGPVADVREVVIEGESVEESAYRVDASGGTYLLVRTDGECWPTCSDDFSVTYGVGTPLPATLVTAVALLACEYAKGLSGGDCKLPARMTRLSRQGVDIEVDQVGGETNSTGIREVDDLIAALNPSGRQAPPVLLSPDLPGNCDRISVWP